MRDLHVVAVTADGKHLVLATTARASRGGFRIPIDGRLRAALRGDLPAAGADATGPVDPVTPRQMQALLRTGYSVQEVAALAEMPVSKVERFAGPVLSELAVIVSAARAVHQSRAGRPDSVLAMGEAVEAGLALSASLRPETVGWSARRTEAGGWVVVLRYHARGERQAEWAFSTTARSLEPLDKLAAALGYAARDTARTQVAASTPAAPAGTVARRAPTGRRPAADDPPSAEIGSARSRVTRPASLPAPPAAALAPERRARAQPPARSAARPPAAPVRAPAGRRVVGVPAAVGRPSGSRRGLHEAGPASPGPAADPPVDRGGVAPLPADPVAVDRHDDVSTTEMPRIEDGATSPPHAGGRRYLRAVPDSARTGSIIKPPARTGRARAALPSWADVLLTTAVEQSPAADGADQGGRDGADHDQGR